LNDQFVTFNVPTFQHSTPGYAFCTYFDRNYLTRGLALYASLVRHCQRPFSLWILCFDDETYAILTRLNLPGVHLISQQEFEADDAELVRTKATRSRVEYYWTCTPSLPRYILRRHPEVDLITYLDADLYFYGAPQLMYDELGSGSILIIEHRYAPEHAELATTSGIYNVGVMVFRRDARGLACLQWWRERCLEWCYMRAEDGRFGDQKYLDDWPQRFHGVVVLQHPGAGLAPWNLSRYDLRFGRSGATVDGLPLVFYHFHGYKAVSKRIVQISGPSYRISSHQVRWLYQPYIAALKQAECRASAGGWAATHGKFDIEFDDVRKGLMRQRLFLVDPVWLGELIWRLSGWRLANWELEEVADRAFAAGEHGQARDLAWHLIRRNPLVLRRKSVVAMLLHASRSAETPG